MRHNDLWVDGYPEAEMIWGVELQKVLPGSKWELKYSLCSDLLFQWNLPNKQETKRRAGTTRADQDTLKYVRTRRANSALWFVVWLPLANISHTTFSVFWESRCSHVLRDLCFSKFIHLFFPLPQSSFSLKLIPLWSGFILENAETLSGLNTFC